MRNTWFISVHRFLACPLSPSALKLPHIVRNCTLRLHSAQCGIHSWHFCIVWNTVWWFLAESGLWGWLIVNWVHVPGDATSVNWLSSCSRFYLKKHFSHRSMRQQKLSNLISKSLFSPCPHLSLYEYLNLVTVSQPYCMLDHFNLQIAGAIMICMDCTLFEVGLCGKEKAALWWYAWIWDFSTLKDHSPTMRVRCMEQTIVSNIWNRIHSQCLQMFTKN